MSKGKIITIAGVPSTGKTTIGKSMSDKFGISFLEENWKAIPFFVEGKTPTNFEICIGFLNLRFEQITQANKLALEGNLVLMDTFFEMTSVYSKQILPSDEYNEFKKIFDVLKAGIPEPDIYIHLTGDLEIIRRRALDRKLGIQNEEQLVSLENLQNTEKQIVDILSHKDLHAVVKVDVTKTDIRTSQFLEDFYNQLVKI